MGGRVKNTFLHFPENGVDSDKKVQRARSMSPSVCRTFSAEEAQEESLVVGVRSAPAELPSHNHGRLWQFLSDAASKDIPRLTGPAETALPKPHWQGKPKESQKKCDMDDWTTDLLGAVAYVREAKVPMPGISLPRTLGSPARSFGKKDRGLPRAVVTSHSRPDTKLSVATTPFSATSTARRMQWIVEAAMIESDMQKATLQPFQFLMPGIGQISFKASLFAEARNHKCSGTGFKNSRGKGRLELKCEDSMPVGRGTLRVAASLMTDRKLQQQGLLRQHDFAHQPCCAFRKWDFKSALDPATRHFVVEVTLQTVANEDMQIEQSTRKEISED